MAINLITWAGQTVTPKYDAILQDICVGRSGILYGCDVSANYNVLTIGAGYGVIKGRLFEVTETTITVTIPQGSSDRTLAIRLDLANVDRPIQIGVLQVGDQPTQDEAANYTNGVYELVLATFLMTPNGIRYLEQAENRVSYTRPTVYTSASDIGDTQGVISALYNTMTNNSIAVLSQDDIRNDLPYSGAVGTFLIFKKSASVGQCFFLSEAGKPNYKCDSDNGGGNWEILPSEKDIYYTENETITLYMSSAGFLTNGGQEIHVSVPTNRRLHSGRNLVLVAGKFTVRQNGKYLAGSGSTQENINTEMTTFTIYNNMIMLKIGNNTGGYSGINNDVVGVNGWVRFIEG